MADYTSSQAGNWNVSTTWGGAGTPSVNGDTATIGHAVAYNIGQSNTTFNDVTINSGGKLTFPTNASSTILFDTTGAILVNNGGELEAGTSSTPVGANYVCEFHFPQGAAIRECFTVNSGGTLSLYGDPDYYGDEMFAYLDSNWTTGTTFYITGDFSSKWEAGQHFWINKNALYSSWLTDSDTYTIDVVGSYDSGNDRTPITIQETAPALTYTAVNSTTGWKSKIIMLSRNIEIADITSTTSWDVYGYNTYTERVQFDSDQVAAVRNIFIDNVLFRALNRCEYGGNNTVSNRCVVLNSDVAFHSIVGLDATDIVLMSNRYAGLSVYRCSFTGYFLSNDFVVSGGNGVSYEGDFIGNDESISNCTGKIQNSNFVGNDDSIYAASEIDVINCNFYQNNYAIRSLENLTISHCDFTGNDTGYISPAIRGYGAIFTDCTFEGIDRTTLKVVSYVGEIDSIESGDGNWQAPASGNSWILEVTPNSYCADYMISRLSITLQQTMFDYVTAASHTLTFKIYPSGYSTALTQDDVILKVRYLDSASGITLSEAVNSTATYSNGAWRSVSVTFTPSQEGLCYFELYATSYDTSSYFLVDPIWSIT